MIYFGLFLKELLLALQRFGDPGNLSSLRGHFQVPLFPLNAIKHQYIVNDLFQVPKH